MTGLDSIATAESFVLATSSDSEDLVGIRAFQSGSSIGVVGADIEAVGKTGYDLVSSRKNCMFGHSGRRSTSDDCRQSNEKQRDLHDALMILNCCMWNL